jgi:DNA invertase Pin-like site-specific DNA recombinase
MMEAVARREVDVVIVAKLDRLGRSTIDLLNTWDDIEARGVRVVVLDQSIDTATPLGKFTRTVLAGVAELEREIIRERIKSGIVEKRRRNEYHGGRPRLPELTERRIIEVHTENPGISLRELVARVPAYRTKTDRERRVSIATVSRVLQKHGLGGRGAGEGKTAVPQKDDSGKDGGTETGGSGAGGMR